ncbi:DDE-1 domain-containing protein [Trichonephila clavipes]|nr:DDE-1 domain-containing protein [Trichonephila clavipes]
MRKPRSVTSCNTNMGFVWYAAVSDVFSKDEESAPVQYLIVACNMHFELSKQVKKTAFEYAKANGTKISKSWDAHCETRDQWYFDFLKRNKVFSLRKSQATSLARATSFNKTNVDTLFLQNIGSKYYFWENHKSHVSIEAIILAKEHGIVMLTFPPHTSHKLQPLDRGVFSPFKNSTDQHVVIGC